MTQILDWKLCTDEKEKYHAYLCSEEWYAIRLRVMERAKDTCERCKRAPADNVHHVTYIRKYREELHDLMAVCKPCHDAIHAIRKKDIEHVQQLRSALDDETVKLCLTLAAKRSVIETFQRIKALHPELILDDWLRNYAENHAYKMDCDKYGIKDPNL